MRGPPVTLSSIFFMDSPADFTPVSDANVPAPEQTGGVMSNEIRRILEDMYARQRQMEVELAQARSDLDRAEAERRQRGTNSAATTTSGLPDGRSLTDLLAILTQAVTALSQPNPDREPAAPREWKPPT
jgi:hypothetical protein